MIFFFVNLFNILKKIRVIHKFSKEFRMKINKDKEYVIWHKVKNDDDRNAVVEIVKAGMV